MRTKLAAGAVATIFVAAPAGASAARFAVGLDADVSAANVAARVERVTDGRVTRELHALGALTLHAADVGGVRGLRGVAWVERIDTRRRLAFVPNDPLATRQWHLPATRAFDSWAELPLLPAVRVAVIDSGIDAAHPEFRGRIAAARSFAGGSARRDEQGHGTFVAGLIAAAANNGEGIAGMTPSARLLVAKVVRSSDRTVSLEDEVRAIRWAADRGARVINLSLGGVRDPRNPARDSFSRLEAAAVEYAYGRGALVVAAVGNADQAPTRPWQFAGYPAALPHVVGVSALARDGSVPSFSNRDGLYNDIAAPGEDLLSTLPRALTEEQPGCGARGYSECGPDDFRRAEGTSFAAPIVTAAAATLFSLRPDLTANQVAMVLRRSAIDATPANGCRPCVPGRDELTGSGRVDVAGAVAALSRKLPDADRLEPNDDAGPRARRLWGRRGARVQATVDFWDDQTDVYAVRARAGQRLAISLRAPASTRAFLWSPATPTVEGLRVVAQRRRLAQTSRQGVVNRLTYRARARGWYFVQVKVNGPGGGAYTLNVRKH